MERVRIALRIPEDLALELRERANYDGVTLTDTAISSFRLYLSGGTQGGTQEAHKEAHKEADAGTQSAGASDAVIEALTAQLDVKDGQIARLMDALSQAQESVKAAQMLDAAHTAKALDGERSDEAAEESRDAEATQGDGATDEAGGILTRFRRWLRG